MSIATSVKDGATERLSVIEVEGARRLGAKGPNAAAWLQRNGLTTPEQPNTWCLPRSGAADADLIARLGSSEFFLEDRDGANIDALARELAVPMSGIYPVLREDRAFVLEGELSRDALAQVCSMNFDELPHPYAAVMTMMIGVAVIVVPQGNAAQRRYRIWCDPSYGDYLLASLRAVVADISSQHGE